MKVFTTPSQTILKYPALSALEPPDALPCGAGAALDGGTCGNH